MRCLLKKAMEEEVDGSISYSTYMNIVLYDEKYGYYMKERPKIGGQGDFFTNSNISSVFAKTFARLFSRLVEDGAVAPHICEIGGGTGKFAYDFLTEWEGISKDTFAKLRYSIIEVSPFHQKLQNEKLSSFCNVVQHCTYEGLGGSFRGIVFSNELFDAFPVEVVTKKDGLLHEVRVTYDGEHCLKEVLRPLQRKDILRYLKKHNIELKDGQRFEVPLIMSGYVNRLMNWLHEGLLITIDYGYTNEEWGHPVHAEGSLRGYYKHRLIYDPLEYPGEMDITSHIHVDELKVTAEELGLQTIWHTNQRDFLLAANILEQLVQHEDLNPFSEVQKQNRAIRSIVLQGGISDSFQIIVQKKGMPHFEMFT
ncbi:hypothetical protein BAMA_22335 [Bacillus manliponensis]|uniref:SAM-dependent methyltransferase n=1 Tax=Bacillus manliponensis TaxID=574376 RepID=A0A073KB65_9BACI|nr:SAM-dependent methyltransferase [Bacillus manliponensis]KEK19533.1 hypothetical protein BAMA_22335 [Bacillus manliponensis]